MLSSRSEFLVEELKSDFGDGGSFFVVGQVAGSRVADTQYSGINPMYLKLDAHSCREV